MSKDIEGYNSEEIIECFYHYMQLSKVKPPTAKQYFLNIEDKMQDPAFTKDMDGLIDTRLHYNIREASDWFVSTLLPLIDQLKPKFYKRLE